MTRPIAGVEESILAHLAPIATSLDDPTVTDIVIDRPGTLFVERATGWQTIEDDRLNYAWCEEAAKLARNLACKSLDAENPSLGTRLPGNVRVHVVVPPAVEDGRISIALRRTTVEVRSLDDLIAGGAFEKTCIATSLLLDDGERARLEASLPEGDQTMLAMLRAHDWKGFFAGAVARCKNIVSSGATGSGKTTLGNALAALIPANERVATVEDTREIRLPHANQFNLQYSKDADPDSRLSARARLEDTLRMRPDRVLLSELRGAESFYFIQNVLNSGHPGTITTVHASSAKLAFHRLGMMIKSSREGAGLDLVDIMESLYTLIDVVVQMERRPDGQRVVTEVYYDPAFAARQLG